MKTYDIIRNSYILSKSGLDKNGLLSKIMSAPDRIAQTVVGIAAFYLTAADSKMRYFSNINKETSYQKTMNECSNFTVGINELFAGKNFIILNSDDNHFNQALSATPSEFIWNDPSGFDFTKSQLKSLSIRSLSTYISERISETRVSIIKAGAKIRESGELSSSSDYKTYSRMVIASQIERARDPHSMATNNRRSNRPRLSVIDIADKTHESLSISAGIFFAHQNNDYNRSFIFMHELGHTVNPLTELNDFSENFLKNSFSFDSGWVEECFADCYAASLNAKITGNWDMITSTIMPFRSYSYLGHNTYHILNELKKEDPSQFANISEKNLWKKVNEIVIGIVKNSVDPELLRVNEIASDHLHSSIFGFRYNMDELDDGVMKNAQKRIQSIIDGVLINGARSREVDDFAIGGLASALKSINEVKISEEVIDLVGKTYDEKILKIYQMSSPEAIAILSRQDLNQDKLIQYFSHIESTGRLSRDGLVSEGETPKSQKTYSEPRFS